MSRHPEVKWAQREDTVFITILLPDSIDAKVTLEPEGVLSYSATAGSDNNLYELKLELFDKVNVEESKINKGARSAFCIIEKTDKVWWKKLLRGDGKTPHYLKVDWDKWVDEDDEGDAAGGANNMDMGGMDFSKFGGMGGMGGMGGIGGMPGMEGLEGMPGMGGLGGMPGMGGPGGMPGMGGLGGMPGMEGLGAMGDDLDDSDDEGEVVAPPDVGAKEAKTKETPATKST